MPAAKTSAKTAANLVSWRAIPPAPIILLQGPEEYLAHRAMESVRASMRRAHPELELNHLEASGYSGGELLMASSPSLFGEYKLIEVLGLASMSDAFLSDALAYLAAPEADCVVVMQHGGGVRGKKLLDALKAAGYPVVECQPLKKDAEKAEFVKAEFKDAQRRFDADAVRALVSAVGSQLSELAAACQQLISDVDGPISAELVDKYYGGRVEATAFKVADAAVAGNGAVALSSLRHALSTGVDPVPLVASLAMKIRAVAKVYGARGSSAGLAKELGMAPWQVDQARREAERWTEEGLVEALQALALADAQVKGAGRDPVYAVERAVVVIATAARGR
ncbi:DNA polymerase-3 subunit delta [Psychromicrobium silvestre]|uniref:DNA-directed DNA polymerase n=1 Tax=Psychromicrobium silvestre TaxID=1645614 RepID=A0A7Y9LRQ3_9MICC|nr:DNA polymerase-3 subunit delta [Psychromicrobium silvestre]